MLYFPTHHGAFVTFPIWHFLNQQFLAESVECSPAPCSTEVIFNQYRGYFKSKQGSCSVLKEIVLNSGKSTLQWVKKTLPRVTNTEKRLSTIISMVASISVSFTSPRFIAGNKNKKIKSNETITNVLLNVPLQQIMKPYQDKKYVKPEDSIWFTNWSVQSKYDWSYHCQGNPSLVQYEYHLLKIKCIQTSYWL